MSGPKKGSVQGQTRLTSRFQTRKTIDSHDQFPVKEHLKTSATANEDQQAKLQSQQLNRLNSDPRYQTLLESLTQVQAVHQEDLTTVDKLLRQFDLNTSYGPCAGISRLDRWNRAQRLGQDPPAEIREILDSGIGSLERYKYSYLGAYP